ncbi:hypothetical protein CYMTET_29876 [Cymbomonas tetramitiformis]|uniref:[histone H3]-lysine(27) N-trimethyltransferase n=1 Tax=Cymbomonas tetramitiformis TaxID=36881 RepID=A0AAE0FK52_9CHLO|nr:hypothetical protein CYMTET_29876 [Cymbomonas tetramitiformis]
MANLKRQEEKIAATGSSEGLHNKCQATEERAIHGDSDTVHDYDDLWSAQNDSHHRLEPVKLLTWLKRIHSQAHKNFVMREMKRNEKVVQKQVKQLEILAGGRGSTIGEDCHTFKCFTQSPPTEERLASGCSDTGEDGLPEETEPIEPRNQFATKDSAELEDATANAVRDRAAQRRAQLAEANRQRQIKEEAARAAEARSTLGRRPVMRPVRVESSHAGKVQTPACIIGKSNNVPSYTTWVGITKNSMTQEDEQRQLLYADTDGEMIAGSDEEGDDDTEYEENTEDYEWTRREDFIIMMLYSCSNIDAAGKKELANFLKVPEKVVAMRYEEVDSAFREGKQPLSLPSREAMTKALEAPSKEQLLEALKQLAEHVVATQLSPEASGPRWPIPPAPTHYSDMANVMDSFHTLFCRRCCIFDCQMHGCDQTAPRLHSLELDESNGSFKLPFSPFIPGGVAARMQPPPPPPPDLTMPPPLQALACSSCSCWLLPSEQARPTCSATPGSAQAGTARQPAGNHREPAAKNAESAMRGGSRSTHDPEPVATVLGKRSSDSPAVTSPKQRAKTAAAASSAPQEWTQLEEELFEYACRMFGEDPCKAARLVNTRSCREMYERMLCAARKRQEALEIDEADQNDPHLNGTSGAKTKKSRGRNGRKRNASVTVRRKLGQIKNRKTGAVYNQYVPCNCKGPCSAECSCLLDGNVCEKYCGCAMTCKNRFRGCNCSKGQCRTRACPCFAADRECDPDLCKGCTATAAYVARLKTSLCTSTAQLDELPEKEYTCQNMKLRLGQHRHIYMGLSQVAGWGAFLNEYCKKEDFLGEYTGELISQNEADRRGKVYDRSNRSFLFNLNTQWVLDAQLKGNKLKFANHSATPNCHAKVILVDGDHRVGIFAKENIKAGEELFYNYGYDEKATPKWWASDGPHAAAASQH